MKRISGPGKAHSFASHVVRLPKHACRMAREIGILVLSLMVVFLGEFCLGNEEVTQCIDGPYHKDKPSPEGPEYVDCLSWRNKTCCTANFTVDLKRNNVEVLYNFSWNHCKNLSKVSLMKGRKYS